jgi:hypothetical protein
MNLLLLISTVCALNFADSIYSATFFLSKAIDIYPLFPIVDEIAFYNQDQTLDYSTLISGAENKYDAINAYETLIYLNFPVTMTDEQKGNMTQSLYYIRDVESAELGDYCRVVYQRIHQRYGLYLGLGPLPVTKTTTTSTTTATPTETEVILDRRATSSDDILAEDIVDRYTVGGNITEAFYNDFLSSFNATLLAYRTIDKFYGNDFFLYNSGSQPVITSTIQTSTVTQTLSSETPDVTEIILDKRSEIDTARLNYENAMRNFPRVFQDMGKVNRLVQKVSDFTSKKFGFEKTEAATLVGLTIGAAALNELKLPGAYVLDAAAKFKTDATLKNAMDTLRTSEILKTSLIVYLKLDFATSLIHGSSSNTETLTSMVNGYVNDPTVRTATVKDMVYNALTTALEPELDKEVDDIFGDSAAGKKGVGLTKFLIERTQMEADKGEDAQVGKLMVNIRLLNKMSFLSGANDVGFDVDGLDMHDLKTQLKNKQPMPPRLKVAIDKFKTPVDHLQDQINTLVNDKDFIASSGGKDTDDPAEFFRDNQDALKKIASKPRINNQLKNIAHSLSNITKDGKAGEDIGEISDILVGDGTNNFGLVGDKPNPSFKAAAAKLRKTPRVKKENFLKSKINITLKKK